MHCFEEIYCPHENLFNSERYVDFNENLFVLRDRERERSCTQLRTRGFSLYKSPCSPAVIRMGKPRKSTTGQQRKSVGPACPGLLPVLNDHPPSWRKVPQLPQRNEGNALVCSYGLDGFSHKQLSSPRKPYASSLSADPKRWVLM